MIHRNADKTFRLRRKGLPSAILTCLALIGTGLYAGEPRAPHAQSLGGRKASANLGVRLSSGSLVGSPVINELGYEGAVIDELLIDPETGRIDWVIIALDPTASSTVAVPWTMLVVEADGTMRVSATADDLVPLPVPRWDATRPHRESAEVERLVPRENFFPPYDPNSFQRFDGIVVGSVIAPIDEGVDLVILVVDVGGDDLRIHVGPEWYVESQGLEIEAGDPISFAGSMVSLDGEPVVLVSELTSDGRRATFRNAAGYPLW